MSPDERKNVKVLLTGCTAQQISPAVDSRIPTFAGLVRKALESQGAEVVWLEPHMEMDRDFVSMFDSVIVGLVSPASLAANHMYPALAVAKAAHEEGRLSIMADAPEPHRLWSGMVSAVQNPGSLVKPFYARRRAYSEASSQETYEALQGFLGALVSQEWPFTLAPRLPWSSGDFLTRHIPQLLPSRSLGLALDRGLELPLPNPLAEVEERPEWLADDPSSAWAIRLAPTLSYPVAPLRSSRADTAADLASRMRGTLGTLVTTYRSGEPWWTPVIRLSLLHQSPVVSDWRVTSLLGPSWAHLASGVETMDAEAREKLAREQMDLYDDATPDFDAESDRLLEALAPSRSWKRKK